MIFATTAFVLWGLLPVYFAAVDFATPEELVAQRTVWAFVLLAAYFVWQKISIKSIAQDSKPVFGRLCIRSVFLGCNWLLFVYSVVNGMVLETSLGYFIAPLTGVLLGTVCLHERLDRMHIIAVLLAACGIAIKISDVDTFPWLALGIALSWNGYSIMNKLTPMENIRGLFVETTLLVPFALIWLLFLFITEQTAMTNGTHTLLLIASGAVTVVPLFFFGKALRRLDYTVVSFFNYITPTMSFILAITYFGEHAAPATVWSFLCIWIALVVMSFRQVRALLHRTRR